MDSVCSECGALLPPNTTCRMVLDQMILWDFEDFMGVGKVHLMTVMCYNLQHPRLYSREGLAFGIDTLLTTMSGEGVDAVKAARGNSSVLAGMGPDVKLTALPGNVASYPQNPVWTMTASDVASGGVSGYPDRVRSWAVSIYTSLLESGNLT